jgi:hypothetical protein
MERRNPMANDNGWPDPSKPGVPLHPERDGWHWLARNADDAWPFYWVSGTESGWCAEDGCNVDCADTEPEFMAHYWPRYLGPCLTPVEVAAREAAAAQVMREACAVRVAHLPASRYEGDPCQWIRALALPDASALDAMLAEAKREGMREAAGIDCIHLSDDAAWLRGRARNEPSRLKAETMRAMADRLDRIAAAILALAEEAGDE